MSCKRINNYNNYGLDPCFCPFLPLLHFTAFEIMNGKVALSALVNTVALFETPYNFPSVSEIIDQNFTKIALSRVLKSICSSV